MEDNPAFFYLANPKHGGWVTFNAHLIRQFKSAIIFKIANRAENKLRPFGWGTFYQNVSTDSMEQIPNNNIVITALEKSHYHLFPIFNKLIDSGKRLTIITHDTVEFKTEALNWLRSNQDKINLIAIRENIKRYLKEYQQIDKCKFILHPFYQWFKDVGIPETIRKDSVGAVSISRVDFDKHTELLVQANELLPKDNKIYIYGKINRLFEFHKLNSVITKEDQRPFSKNYPYYVKPLDLSFIELTNILHNTKFSIDMSAIVKDGGGTQYTFLESIYMGVPLILNKKWETKENNTFIHENNCYMADNAREISNIILNNKKEEYEQVATRAKVILKDHNEANKEWVNELTCFKT